MNHGESEDVKVNHTGNFIIQHLICKLETAVDGVLIGIAFSNEARESVIGTGATKSTSRKCEECNQC